MQLQKIGGAALLLPALLAVLFFGASSALADSYDNYYYSSSSYGSDQSGAMHRSQMYPGMNQSLAVPLRGSEEVPPVSTPTSGSFQAQTSGSSASYTLDVWNGHDITMAHVHCGSPGQNGPVVVSLYENQGGVDVNGRLTSGTIHSVASTGANCSGVIGYPIDDLDDLAKAATEGKLYINVHDKAHPNGVIRGQIPAHHSDSNAYDSAYDDKKDHDYDKKDYSDKSTYEKNDYDKDKSYSCDRSDHTYGKHGSDSYDNSSNWNNDWDKKDCNDGSKSDWKDYSSDWDKNDRDGYTKGEKSWDSKKDHDKDWSDKGSDNYDDKSWSKNDDWDMKDSRDHEDKSWSKNDWDKEDSHDWNKHNDSEKTVTASAGNTHVSISY